MSKQVAVLAGQAALEDVIKLRYPSHKLDFSA